MQATLRLQDAWEDIQRRHSTLPASSTPAPRARAASVGGGTPRRHRPGRSRAIPVEEDDIIDLSTLDFVEDRGVLRNSKAGGFAIGAYGGTGDQDIVVGLDTGGGDDEGTEVDEDEDEEEELEDYTDSDAESYTSEDELGELDELPSQPSLVFREERRKEAERLKEVLEFQQHEALARGASAAPSRRATPKPGNEVLPQPITAADDDELDLFATPPPPASAPRRRQSSASLTSPSKTPQRVCQPQFRPPSATSALRHAVDRFHLASPAPSSPRSKSRPPASSPSSRAFSAPPKPVSRTRLAGLATPPSSVAAGRTSQPPKRDRPSKTVSSATSRSEITELIFVSPAASVDLAATRSHLHRLAQPFSRTRGAASPPPFALSRALRRHSASPSSCRVARTRRRPVHFEATTLPAPDSYPDSTPSSRRPAICSDILSDAH